MSPQLLISSTNPQHIHRKPTRKLPMLHTNKTVVFFFFVNLYNINQLKSTELSPPSQPTSSLPRFPKLSAGLSTSELPGKLSVLSELLVILDLFDQQKLTFFEVFLKRKKCLLKGMDVIFCRFFWSFRFVFFKQLLGRSVCSAPSSPSCGWSWS